jgi:hypothetical protein
LAWGKVEGRHLVTAASPDSKETDLKHALTLVATIMAVSTGAIPAHAGCVDPRMAKQGMAHIIPTFMLPKASAGASVSPAGDTAHKIVGTWMVTYTSEGQPFAQAFIQWHDDGTEWENINLPVSSGNLCVGSWVSVDKKDVSRNHIGWLYNNDDLAGYFTETESDHLDSANAYSGTNDTKIFDVNGNLLGEVAGTSSAVRLAP